MNEAKKPGILAAWYGDLKDFKGGPGRPLPHLTAGPMIVTVLVGSTFVTRAADAIAIIAGYGWHAFFVEGLRVTDWKHDGLSNGGYLSFFAKLVQVPATLLLMVVVVCATDFTAMLIRKLLGRSARWIWMSVRVLGGAGLMLLALSFYRQDYPRLHPGPLAAFIGGALLVWKTVASILRGQM